MRHRPDSSGASGTSGASVGIGAAFLLALALLLFACIPCAQAQAPRPVPALSARVIDQTGSLNTAQVAALEQTLEAFERQKGSQIAVLIVATSAPETIEQYALRVVEVWKLGRKKVDDGALLLIAKDDRAMRIEVGYGLEGVLNDATSKRIISDILTPKFRQGDFHGGISLAVESMIKVVQGEPLPAPKRRDVDGEWGFSLFPAMIFFALIVGGILRGLFGRLPAATLTGFILAIGMWLLAGVIFTSLVAGVIGFLFTLGGGGLGRFGSWHGGPFGGSGGHSGFGGGGGNFGGGGASGKW